MKIISGTNLITKPNQAAAPKFSPKGSALNFVVQNNVAQTPKQISAAYFHPSFGNEVKRLTDFLDYAIKNPLDTHLLETTLKQSGQHFFHTIRQIINTEPMGAGNSGMVFRLDDKFVIKKQYSVDMHPKKLLHIIDNSNTEDLKTWKGAIKAKLFNLDILENANPNGNAIQVGAPYNPKSRAEKRDHYFKKYLPACENLPQSAFDEIAQDFQIINSKSFISPTTGAQTSYCFDWINPNNLLINNNKIIQVDQFILQEWQGKNTLSDFCTALLMRLDLGSDLYFEKEFVSPRRVILKKSLLACERHKLPTPREDELMVPFDLADIPWKWPLTLKKINELRAKIPDNHEERVWELEKFFDKL